MIVLITRPEPDASAFAAACKAHGIAPVVAPLMEIVPSSRDVSLLKVGALAFTSANGVRAFSANSQARDLPVFAVGAASAGEAEAFGFGTVYTAYGDAASLAHLIAQERASINGEVLHIAGTHRAGDLVAALAALGLPARREVLYETRDASALPEEALAALASDEPRLWAAFFSPRSVELFLTLAERAGAVPLLARARAACLSEAVGEKAKAVQWKSVEIAAGRHVDAMIELLCNA